MVFEISTHNTVQFGKEKMELLSEYEQFQQQNCSILVSMMSLFRILPQTKEIFWQL